MPLDLDLAPCSLGFKLDCVRCCPKRARCQHSVRLQLNRHSVTGYCNNRSIDFSASSFHA